MGLMCWLFYCFLGLTFFVIIMVVQNKFSITKFERLVFSIILLMISSGLCYKFAIKYTENIFLSFVFLMIVDIIYSSYLSDKDFFDKEEKNVFYYIVLIFFGFFVNQEFVNQVSQVFLTGEDLRIILWFLVFLFLYSFIKEKDVLSKTSPAKAKINYENILVQYAKLRYRFHNECDSNNKDISNILYAIMIFNNNRKGKLFRNYDYFLFRLNGNKRPLGIMQVESNKFITDSESIEIVRKKIEKLYERKTKLKSKVSIQDIINNYDKNNALEIQNIFNVIQKF